MSENIHHHHHQKEHHHKSHHNTHHHNHDHFEVIDKNFAHGVHSKVSIVRRESDGELLVWKQPRTSNIYTHIESFRQEIIKSKSWRKFGVSNVKIFWHPNNISLLKTYIKGPTLKQILEENPRFFSETENKPVKALGKLVELLICSKCYIADLNRQNLVFDGDRWHVIDSSWVYRETTFPDIREKYKKFFLKSWSKSIPKDEKHAVKSFIDKYCH